MELSYKFLWDGYDLENKFGPNIPESERFYTYLTEYKECDDKFYLVYLVTWIILFTKYISNISKTKINRIKWEKNIFIIIYILSCIAVLLLPIHLVNKGEIRYTYGPGVSLVYGLSLTFIIYCLILMFFNINKKVASRYSSLFILTSLGALAMVIQSTYPGLLLITSVSTFVTFIMYFTTLNNEVISKLENEKK